MSKFKKFESGETGTCSLFSRPSLVNIEDFARFPKNETLSGFLDSLPGFLAADDLRALVSAIREARSGNKPVIWGFGGHVVKVGLAPVLIELMDQGFVTGLATNGSGMIHDFEIALAGKTSEDVAAALEQGSFGLTEETGSLMNQAFREGVAEGLGLGESLGRFLDQNNPEYGHASLVLQAYRRDIPITSHVALGTDVIHMHPSAEGEVLGRGSMIDFKVFTQQVSLLHGGGVYLNLGSAVLLPEVFLKAVSLVRGSGRDLSDFTTANLDFIQHYRPRQNVIGRPVSSGGKGIALTGHHEIMVPLLAALLVYS
ncbi:MAG: hypothetical protein ABIJ42_06685 [Acidobacteriota bacterium]